MNNKQKKQLKEYFRPEKPSPQEQFRIDMRKQGYELVDITQLCKFELGISGWCNNFNEPEQQVYHIQIWYRGQNVANINGANAYVIDDDKYAVWIDKSWMDAAVPESDFVLYRKVPVK